MTPARLTAAVVGYAVALLSLGGLGLPLPLAAAAALPVAGLWATALRR